MATERSRESAWKAVKGQWKHARDAVTDPDARSILTEDLLQSIFRLEWASQFEERRSEVQGKMKQMVNDAIDALKLGDRP